MSSELLRSRTRRFGIVLLCAKVALVPLVFDTASDQSFTLPKALVSHALAYALLAVMLGLLARFGTQFLVWSAVHLPVLAFLAANIVATTVAVDPRLALFGAHGRMLGLGTIADWVVLYFAFIFLVRTRSEALATLAAVFIPTTVVIAYEITQVTGHDPFRWSLDSGARPFSTLGQPTTLGAYLVILSAGLVVLAATVESLRRWQRAALLWWAGLLVVGAVDSGTRSIILGAAAAILVVPVVIWARSPTPRARAVTAGVTFGAALLLALVVLLTPLGNRVALTLVGGGTSVEVDPSTAARLELYRIATGMFMERPMLGYGPDSFAAGVPKFRPAGASETVRQSLATSAHGWIPYVATGSGILGLLAFMTILAPASRTLIRSSNSPTALCGAAMVAAFLGTGLFTIDDIGVDWLFWLGVALIASPAGPARESQPFARKRGGRRRSGGAPDRSWRGYLEGTAVAIGILTVLLGVPAWNASRAAKASGDLLLFGTAREAVETSLAAVKADDGRAEYWHGLGLAYASARRYRDASFAFARASSLAPYDVLHIEGEAQADLVLAASGDQAARARALELSDHAVRMDANNPRAQLLRATTLRATGDDSDAEPFVRRALALDIGSANELLYVTAVQVLVADGYAEEAIGIARDGLPHLPVDAVGLRLELARALGAAGHPQDALKELDQLLAIHPDLAPARDLRDQIQSSLR